MKKFIMKDESFTCNNCGYFVNPLKYTARDHCPNCLYSIHIDINPGDRKNECFPSFTVAIFYKPNFT